MSMLKVVFPRLPGRTKQSFREEVDINKIVARSRAGQIVSHVARGVPTYQDVSDVGDYKGALDMVRNADAFFQKLPAKVRAAFGNDPAAFLDATESNEGRAKLVELGLAKPIPSSVPVRDAAGRFAVDKDGDGAADANPAAP